MIGRIQSSRERFGKYRETLPRRYDPAARRKLPGDPARPDAQAQPRARRSTGQIVVAFWRQLRGYRRAVGTMLVTSGIATLVGLLPPYGMKLIFDNIFTGRLLPPGVARRAMMPTTALGMLWAVVGAMFVLSVISLATRTISDSKAYRLQHHLILRMRRRLLHHGLRLPLHRIRQITSGGMSFIVRYDANAIGDLVILLVYEPWKAIIQLLGCLVVLLWIDWRLLVGALALLPAIYFAQRARIGRIRDMSEDATGHEQQLDGQTAELFGGIRVIRGFGRESTVAGRMLRRHHFVTRIKRLAWWLYRGIDVGWMTIIPLASALLLGFGGARVLHDAALVAAGKLAPADAFSVGCLIMFVAYLAWLLNPLASLARSSAHLQNALAGMNRAMDFFQEPIEPAMQDPARRAPAIPIAQRGALKIRDLWFTYPGIDHPVLRGIDLEVAVGQTVALVGPSGAGKSTLTNLIARFYDPDRGSIELDGIDIRQIDPRLRRRWMALVEQDIFLFDGTIGENIACGNRRATVRQIIEAAKKAHAHGFISQLPEGYDTLVGERGLRFSGGQRQRIAIARAMLADPRILILDEATSHLDPENERLIQQSLTSLMVGRTCFIIAHRLSTIRHADQIAVFEDGRITERGRHEELMLTSTRYRRMIELQLGAPEILV